MNFSLPSSLLTPMLGALVLGISTAGAAVVVNEQFADGNTNTQSASNPQDSLQWRFIGVGSGQTFNSGVWTQTPSASNQLMAQFNGVTLSDTVTSVTFSFNYSVTAPQSGNFIRFGMFNSGGSFPTTNNSSTDLTNDVGYTVFGGVPSSATAGSFRLGKESNSNGAIFSTGNNPIIGTAATLGAAVANQTYTASLTITRNSPTSVSLSSTMNGLTVTATDASNTNQSFDYFGIFFGNTMGNISLSNVAITTTTAVPEPSTYSLLAGVACLGFGYLRSSRRRRA